MPREVSLPGELLRKGLVTHLAASERVSLRQRPGGRPIMFQTWDKLLFLHWPVEVDRLRRLVPAGLEIDTWNGTGWVGVTPFTIWGVRPPLVPSIPILSSTHELNVRTYVHRDGVPGIWFLSLDASNWLAVWGARLGFSLPYYHAAIRLQTRGSRVHFHSVRTRRSKPAEFHAIWRPGRPIPPAVPETRDFFLIERYCLYSASGSQLFRSRIHHRPWPLCQARLEQLDSTLFASHGLAEPEEPPLVHAQAEPLHVQVWPLRRTNHPD